MKNKILNVFSANFTILEDDLPLLYKLGVIYDCGCEHDLHIDPNIDMHAMHDGYCYVEILLMAIHRGISTDACGTEAV